MVVADEKFADKNGLEEKNSSKERQKKHKKKNLMVGIRIDKKDQLLLTWALVKIAEPGDRVVAVHVCCDSSKNDLSSEDSMNLAGFLDVYKGLCNVKQLDLAGKVSIGSSVRKVLVREAKLCDAMVVVVGISKKHTLGSWVSVAKYCAKKLPPTTVVLALHDGNIAFNYGFSNQIPGDSSLDVKRTLENNNSSPQVVQVSENGSRDDENDSEYDTLSLASEYKEEISSCSVSGCGSTRDDSIDIAHENKDEASSLDSFAELMKELPGPTPGWPLLKRANTMSPDTLKASDARKMSVVQWAMSLPKRIHSVDPENQNDLCSDIKGTLLERHYDSGDKIGRSCSWRQLPQELATLLQSNSSGCRWFSHKELRNATSQFSSENLIGKGGCSRVYKGCLPGGKQVAAKILKVTKEAWNDFLLEIDIISSLKHKCIVPLVGICLEEYDIILVYDFLSRGSLEDNLHGNREKCVLSWEMRFNVAIGLAEAINYLHKECPRPVIHRDIKSSNILLSNEFKPQLSDFGLAMWAPSSNYETQSDVVGTFGYLAPEYFMYGKVSDKIDMYSFGVVLLELLSGRKPISNETPKGQESLVLWAKPILESGDIMSILDPSLDGKFDEVQMRRMVLAATLCITRIAHLRPQISEILKLLQGKKDVEEWMNKCVIDRNYEEQDGDEAYPDSNAGSYLDLALLDVDDNMTSFSSAEQNSHHTLEDYLKGRWSRSSSFN